MLSVSLVDETALCRPATELDGNKGAARNGYKSTTEKTSGDDDKVDRKERHREQYKYASRWWRWRRRRWSVTEVILPMVDKIRLTIIEMNVDNWPEDDILDDMSDDTSNDVRASRQETWWLLLEEEDWRTENGEKRAIDDSAHQQMRQICPHYCKRQKKMTVLIVANFRKKVGSALNWHLPTKIFSSLCSQ